MVTLNRPVAVLPAASVARASTESGSERERRARRREARHGHGAVDVVGRRRDEEHGRATGTGRLPCDVSQAQDWRNHIARPDLPGGRRRLSGIGDGVAIQVQIGRDDIGTGRAACVADRADARQRRRARRRQCRRTGDGEHDWCQRHERPRLDDSGPGIPRPGLRHDERTGGRVGIGAATTWDAVDDSAPDGPVASPTTMSRRPARSKKPCSR